MPADDRREDDRHEAPLDDAIEAIRQAALTSPSFRRNDVVFALSMLAFAVVGTFCVVAAFTVLLR